MDKLEETTTTTTIVVLTGPPASGKTTIVSMLNDMGVPCLDTGELVEEEYVFREDDTDPSDDDMWQFIESLREEDGDNVVVSKLASGWIHRHVEQQTSVICLSSVREQASIDWLRNTFGNVLSIRIYAPPSQREERYVDRRVTDMTDCIEREHVMDLRSKLYDREDREQPYPKYDLTLVNDQDTSVSELWNKLQNTITAVS